MVDQTADRTEATTLTHQERLLRVLIHIERHLDENLSLETLGACT